MPKLAQDPRDRILSRITEEDRGHGTPCWISDRALDSGGYTRIGWRGHIHSTHRLAYEVFIGPIPDGLQIDHLCRQRTCCNPDHLEPVTSRENTMRGENRNARLSQLPHCARGHEFTPDNTLITRRGTKRLCRQCDCAARRARYAAQRARCQASAA